MGRAGEGFDQGDRGETFLRGGGQLTGAFPDAALSPPAQAGIDDRGHHQDGQHPGGHQHQVRVQHDEQAGKQHNGHQMADDRAQPGDQQVLDGGDVPGQPSE